jgi:hypothetical protein
LAEMPDEVREMPDKIREIVNRFELELHKTWSSMLKTVTATESVGLLKFTGIDQIPSAARCTTL